jgi:hypothetical protein
MSPIEFRYTRPMLVLISLGFPLLLVLCCVLLWASYTLLGEDGLSPFERLNAVVVGFLGVFLGLVLFLAVRDWRSLFTSYLLSRSGLLVASSGGDALLPWTQLRSSRYRKALARIELRFDDYPHLIILNNVDMDVERKMLGAAKEMIEAASGSAMTVTLL